MREFKKYLILLKIKVNLLPVSLNDNIFYEKIKKWSPAAYFSDLLSVWLTHRWQLGSPIYSTLSVAVCCIEENLS